MRKKKVEDIKNEIVKYKDIESRGGWKLVKGNERIKIGVKEKEVKYMRKSMMI